MSVPGHTASCSRLQHGRHCTGLPTHRCMRISPVRLLDFAVEVAFSVDSLTGACTAGQVLLLLTTVVHVLTVCLLAGSRDAGLGNNGGRSQGGRKVCNATYRTWIPTRPVTLCC